ncbi:hypothetical protein GE061_008388 [Apolygus lucorum]|uniref:Uncharacterized protein n=1 Tax=Apolygus lucorum TaxID=248454 RepID=A0A6A4ITP4_APOLU|nr:hypothetical protein GE061_008388 [Apolygus lucorum]
MLLLGPVLYLVTIGVVSAAQMIIYTLADFYELFTSKRAIKCSCKANFIDRCMLSSFEWKNPTCCTYCRYAPLQSCNCSPETVAKCYDKDGDLSESLRTVDRQCCYLCTAIVVLAAAPTPPDEDINKTTTLAPTCIDHCLGGKTGENQAKCYVECFRKYGKDIGPDPETGTYPPRGFIVTSFSIRYRYEVIFVLTLRLAHSLLQVVLVLFVIMVGCMYRKAQKPLWYALLMYLWLFPMAAVLVGYMVGIVLLDQKNDMVLYYGLSVQVFILSMVIWEYHQQKPGLRAAPPSSKETMESPKLTPSQSKRQV